MEGVLCSTEEQGARWSDLQGFLHASLLLHLWDRDQGESPGARPRVPLQGRFTLVETSTAKLAKVHNDQEN